MHKNRYIKYETKIDTRLRNNNKKILRMWRREGQIVIFVIIMIILDIVLSILTIYTIKEKRCH